MAAETFQTTDNLQVVDFKINHRWGVSTDRDKPGVFSLAGTETANVNANVSIFYDYPQQPLTLVIETPYTKTGTPFDVHFTGGLGMSKVYQIVDGEEIEKDGRSNPLVVASDSNYQVVMKLTCGPAQLFGCNIDYHAEAREDY